MLVFSCMSNFWSMVSVPLKNNILNSSEYFAIFLIAVTAFFSKRCVLHHHSHPLVGTVLYVHLCHVRKKRCTFHFLFFLFFSLLKCTHEFAEHCIKFIKNHLILRLQKWMQKEVLFIFFPWGKKMSQKSCTYL